MGVITERERQKYFAYLDGVADGLNESRNDVNEVLDKIRAEINRQEKWLLQAGYTAYNVDIALDAIKSVVTERSEE